MLVREPILAQKVLIVRHEKKSPWTPVYLRICGVPTKPMLPFALPYLTETSQSTKPLGNIDLHVVVEQDKRRRLRFPRLAPWHSLANASCLGAGTDHCRSYPCP